MARFLPLLLSISLMSACGDDTSADAGPDLDDAGSDPDGSGSDAGPACDGGPDFDGGPSFDGGPTFDAGSVDDAGVSDAPPLDAEAPDGGDFDAGVEDAGPFDAGDPDSGDAVCGTDDDCPPTSWCRPTAGGSRACTPYATDGERCGGFVPAFSEVRCGPGRLSCMSDPRLPDAPGVCAFSLTLAEVTGSDRYDGRWVGVTDGRVAAELPICTRRACTAGMPCCNTCNAEETLQDGVSPIVHLRQPSGEAYSCSGTNCDWDTMCTVAQGDYIVIGPFTAGPPDGGTIDVERIFTVF